MAANSSDADALTLRGEMRLDEGDSAKAVADFRQAYRANEKTDSHQRTRDLLREALLDGLRTDFAANRQTAPRSNSFWMTRHNGPFTFV